MKLQSNRLDVIYLNSVCMKKSTKHNSKNIGIMMQNATLLMFMSLQSRNNGNMSDFFHYPFLSVVCSCSVQALDVAALIHIVRSVRAATFNDCIHKHLVPNLKNQITPSANDEMNKITLPSTHRIQNSSPGGLISLYNIILSYKQCFLYFSL